MPAVGCFSSPLPLLGATRFWPGPGAGREASGAGGGWTAAVVWGKEGARGWAAMALARPGILLALLLLNLGLKAGGPAGAGAWL